MAKKTSNTAADQDETPVAETVETPPEVHPVREEPPAEAPDADEDESPEVEPGTLGTGGLTKPPGKRALAAQAKRRSERPAREEDVKARRYLVQITERVSPVAAQRVVIHDADGFPSAFVRRGEKPITERRLRLTPVTARQLSIEGWEVTAV